MLAGRMKWLGKTREIRYFTFDITMKLITAFALLFAASASGAMISINPAADAFITSGPSMNLTLNNYGAAGALSVAAPGSATGEFQSVLRFELASVVSTFNTQYGAGMWAIDSVSMTLSAGSPNNAIFNASAAGSFSIQWMQQASWTEGPGNPKNPASSGITFASLPSFLSDSDVVLGTYSFDGSTSGSNTWNLALASNFAADIAAGGDVSLRMYAADATVSYLSNSRDFGNAASRPSLTITARAVPEPGACALLAGATALLLSGRRRHDRKA